MKSKQINFFITTEDIPAISKFFAENEYFVFKGLNKKDKNIRQYDIVTNKLQIYQVFLAKDEFGKYINFEQSNSDENQLNILNSYCIEFDIGGFYPYSNKELHRSRLYFVIEYYENGKLVRKNKEFIYWAEDLIKRFKKNILTQSKTPYKLLISEHCQNWVKINNAKLSAGGMKFILERGL